MKKILYLLIIIFTTNFLSCRTLDRDYSLSEYEIENRLNSNIEVGFIKKDVNRYTTIKTNETKTVIHGSSGYLGVAVSSFDTAYIKCNKIKYIDTLHYGNSLLSISSYICYFVGKKDGKKVYISRLIIDENFIKKYKK